MYIRISIS
jgi:hypothetical protein